MMNSFEIIVNDEKSVNFSGSFTETLDVGKMGFHSKDGGKALWLTYPLITKPLFDLVFSYQDSELTFTVDRSKPQEQMVSDLSAALQNWNGDAFGFLEDIFRKNENLALTPPGLLSEDQFLSNNNVLVNGQIFAPVQQPHAFAAPNEFGDYIGCVANTGAVGAIVGAAFGNPVAGGLVGVGVGSIICQTRARFLPF